MPTSRPVPTPATAVLDADPCAPGAVPADGTLDGPTGGVEPAPAAGERRVLHMIGNAHLDAAWLWQWPEAFQAAKATFRSALDRMREYPEFVFTASSAAYHEWVERSDPAMFAEIRERVREGRWQIVGGWWVEADCNLPSGESLVRQGLIGQRWFAAHLGRSATVGFNPDAFGHAASLPAILRGQGMDAYLFLRPQPHERDLPPGPFRWQSADGSGVIALRIPFEYCAPRAELDRQLEQVLERLGDGWREHVMFYGVGNHGGGPTRANLDSIGRLSADPALPALRPSSADAFFDRLRSDRDGLPTVMGELQHHSVGCYSAHSALKQLDARAATALTTAETLSVVASRLTGQPYPATELDRAWRSVLFNEFHDIIGGTAIEPACRDAEEQYAEALSIAARAQNDAVQSIGWAIDVPLAPETTPIVVVNQHPWPVVAPVELEFGRLADDARLVDDTGRDVPLQRTRSAAAVTPGHDRSRLAFLARLPALGWAVHHVAPGPSGSILPTGATTTATSSRERSPGEPRPAGSFRLRSTDPDDLRATDLTLSNARLALSVDPVTGTIESLVDRRSGVEFVDAHGSGHGLGAGIVCADASDTWSHGVRTYDRVAGVFRPARIRLVEAGPVRAVIRIEAVYRTSRLCQDVTLWAGRDQVDVEVTVDWHERHRVLKLRFPTAMRAPVATFEVPYAVVERPAEGDEEPGQRWVDVSEPDGPGLAILCDAKHGYDVRRADVGVTVLRSPVFAHHDPYVPDPDLEWRHLDQGEQRFRYALVPHAGPRADARLARRAAELLQRPIPLVETFHAGPLPQRASFGSVEPGSVVLGALKRAEDGDGVVVRAWESDGEATAASIELPFLATSLRASLAPNQLRTWVIPDAADPVETDLVERPLAGPRTSPAASAGDGQP